MKPKMTITKAINMAVTAVSMCQMLDRYTKREIIEALAEAEEKILNIEVDDEE